MSKRLPAYLLFLVIVAVLVLWAPTSYADEATNIEQGTIPIPTGPLVFSQVAEEGFGDRQNSGAWSMQWWNGHLYVGTSRSWYCWSQAWFHLLAPPVIPYPPVDPDMECAEDYRELPLQAEIWRYEPISKVWTRVYQSPKDVEIPGNPGYFTSRESGYRDMVVFKDPDGTEALYVGSTTTYALWPPVPPPRILRTTDGVNWEPIPQEPGTVLGDMARDQTSFRDFEVYKDRLFVLSSAVRGDGLLMEASNPAGGNNSFRWVTDQTMRLFEIAPYNGYLYVGKVGPGEGYSVWKTDATGEPPYKFEEIVPPGAFKSPASPAVVSMHVYNDRLYVGTDSPTEIIRINPDDSWDLIMGTPRQTPEGWKYPLSGLGEGFNWDYTEHIWKMEQYQNQLYVGTLDRTARYAKMIPPLDAQLNWHYGYDLYYTSDGQYFYPLTIDGFGYKLQAGVRSFASTPYGLFMGTVSFWYGLQIWQGIPGSMERIHLPLIATAATTAGREGPDLSAVPSWDTASFHSPIITPQRLTAEIVEDRVLLSWERQAGAGIFRIFRSEVGPPVVIDVPGEEPPEWVSGPYLEIGQTTDTYFIDETANAEGQYRYYIVGDDAGVPSLPSNIAAVPVLSPAMTFDLLAEIIGDRYGEAAIQITPLLAQAREALSAGQPNQSLADLEELRRRLGQYHYTTLADWQIADLDLLLSQLVRRLELAQAGVIDYARVEHTQFD